MDFYYYALEFAAANFQWLLKEKLELEMMKMEASLVKKIAHKNLELHR